MDEVEILNKLGFKEGQVYDVNKDILSRGPILAGYGKKLERYNCDGITYIFREGDEQGKVSFCGAEKSRVEIKCV